jgi:NAD-dependent oxidoreductase involved in siderophore biosynthesis
MPCDGQEDRVAEMMRPVVLTGLTTQGSWRMREIPVKRFQLLSQGSRRSRALMKRYEKLTLSL